MKRLLEKALVLALAAVMLFTLAACKEEPTGLWADAIYTSDTTVGEGKTSVTVDIVCEDKTVTLTVKTDETTLGDALFELGIINDRSFFDTANGMKADWDKDRAYWSFYIGDEYAAHGVGDEVISDGGAYKLVYTK